MRTMKNGVMECFSRLKPGADVAQEKAAEGTAALHDAGARFARPLHIGEAFGVRLSFLALLVRCSSFEPITIVTKLPLRKLEIRCPQPFSRSARFSQGNRFTRIFL